MKKEQKILIQEGLKELVIQRMEKNLPYVSFQATKLGVIPYFTGSTKEELENLKHTILYFLIMKVKQLIKLTGEEIKFFLMKNNCQKSPEEEILYPNSNVLVNNDEELKEFFDFLNKDNQFFQIVLETKGFTIKYNPVHLKKYTFDTYIQLDYNSIFNKEFSDDQINEYKLSTYNKAFQNFNAVNVEILRDNLSITSTFQAAIAIKQKRDNMLNDLKIKSKNIKDRAQKADEFGLLKYADEGYSWETDDDDIIIEELRTRWTDDPKERSR